MYLRAGLLFIVFFSLGATECRTVEDDLGVEEDVEFETLAYVDGEPVQGGNSGVLGKRLLVIRDVNDFTDVWSDHAGNVYPQPAQPEVDFGTNMVIAAFMGQQPTGGYSIDIQDVRENNEFLVVEVEMETPGDNCVVTQALTQPFHMIVLPDSSLPVQFMESTVEAPAC